MYCSKQKYWIKIIEADRKDILNSSRTFILLQQYKSLKGIISQDFGGLQIIWWDGLKVYNVCASSLFLFLSAFSSIFLNALLSGASFQPNSSKNQYKYDEHLGVGLRSMMHTSESDSTVWCTPRSQTPQYDAHLGVRLRSMMHTSEADSAVKCTPLKAGYSSQTISGKGVKTTINRQNKILKFWVVALKIFGNVVVIFFSFFRPQYWEKLF